IFDLVHQGKGDAMGLFIQWWKSSSIFSIVNIALICTLFILIALHLKNRFTSYRLPLTLLIILSLALLLLPAVMLSPSLKYQESSIALGKGYLPVYIQFIGMCLLSSILFFAMLKNAKRNISIYILMGFWLIIIVLNQVHNSWIAEKQNRHTYYPSLA